MKTKKITSQPAPAPEPRIELDAEQQAFLNAWQAQEKAEDNLRNVKRLLANRVESAQHTLFTFRDELLQHPGHALEWSDSAFSAAADLEVSGYALKLLNGGATLADVAKDCLRNALRTGGSSTSPAANLMTHYRQQMSAKRYEDIVGYSY